MKVISLVLNAGAKESCVCMLLLSGRKRATAQRRSFFPCQLPDRRTACSEACRNLTHTRATPHPLKGVGEVPNTWVLYLGEFTRTKSIFKPHELSTAIVERFCAMGCNGDGSIQRPGGVTGR